MKTLIKIALSACLFLGTNVAFAQNKNAADSVVISANIHCQNCVNRIEKSIPFEKGIKKVDTNIDQKRVVVYYDPQKTDPAKILKAFAKIKMDAELID